METFSNRLHQLLNYFGIKQSDMAKRVGIPKSALSMYLNEQREPRQNRLTEIADAYGVNESWLMGYDVPMLKSEESQAQIHQNIGKLISGLMQTDADFLTKLIFICQNMDADQKNRFLSAGEDIINEGKREGD